jgi:uncharacterized protein (DUF983 family)
MNVLSAAIKCKCPQCRQGDVYSHKAYNLLKFSHMNERCPKCDIRLEPEPGFYQGAMYVSYGFSVIGLIVISIILYYTLNPNQWIYIGTVVATMILLAPLNFRYSRILYLYLFGGIHYKPAVFRAK